MTSCDLNKRRFLKTAALGAAALALPGAVSAQSWSPWPQQPGQSPQSPVATPGSPQQGSNPADPFWSKPRVLNLQRYQNNEKLHIVYWKDGQYDVAGYQKICWLLRDLREQKTLSIDARVLDLLCAMQAWVSYYGFSKPFIVTSGYRTPKTNQNTEGAARNSMHMYGKAVDLIVPDLPVSYLGRLAQHYAGGGVGFYPDDGFVHVDSGRVRAWGRR